MKLRLKVNEAKSAVARPEERKFLGLQHLERRERAAHRAKSTRQIQGANPGNDVPDTGTQSVADNRGAGAIPRRVASATSASAKRPGCSQIWRRGSAEDYAHIFGGSGGTGTTASKNCAVVAYRSSEQRSPPVHQRDSGGCQDTRRSKRPCATTTSIQSVFPNSMFRHSA